MFTAKKIVIAGGSGFIGQAMAGRWAAANEIIVLSRQLPTENNAYGTKMISDKIRTVKWDGTHIGAWTKYLDGADILINLAGKSVNCRYNEANKAEIIRSRLDATKVLGNAVNTVKNPPKLWINAASATIYRHATDRPQDEYTGAIEDDFSVQVCKQWEQTFYDQYTPQTRKAALRTAITLGNGGVMIPYFNLVKYGLGGKQGSGRQMYSWVHVTDLCRVVEYIFEHEAMNGTYNVSAPNPVTNHVFMKTLRSICGRCCGLPAYEWMLQIGTRLIGTEAELILKSRWVLPARLSEAGFVFEFPRLEMALKNIVAQVPRRRYHLF